MIDIRLQWDTDLVVFIIKLEVFIHEEIENPFIWTVIGERACQGTI